MSIVPATATLVTVVLLSLLSSVTTALGVVLAGLGIPTASAKMPS
jgi:hypothetical protein